MRPTRNRFQAIDLGPLPVEAINAALHTELEPGQARLSVTAHKHIADKHPDVYALVMMHLADAIADPTYIGQAPEHGSNIELVKRLRMADGSALLIAIGLEPDDRGDYRVRTGYTIDAAKVEARRLAGYLKMARST